MSQLTPEQYKKLQDAGYSPAKIKAYELRKGFTPYNPNQKPSLTDRVVDTAKDFGSDVKEAFTGSVDAVSQGIDEANEAREQVTAGEITPVSGTVKTIGAGAKAGAKVVGEGFMALLKAPFSQKTEDKAAQLASDTASAVAEKAATDFQELKNSDDPADQALANKAEELGDRYQNDANFKAKVDGFGGLAMAAAEFLGLGKGAKVATDAVSDSFAKVRTLDLEPPKINIPYFNAREAEIADGIRQMKLNKSTVDVPTDTPTITAGQQALETPAVSSLQKRLMKELETGINPNKNLDDVTTRVDQLLAEGKYKQAVNVVNANTKDNITTRITQKMIDNAVIAGQKAAETYRSAVEGSTQRISANLDRQALKETAQMKPKDVDQWLADKYVNAVSPGVKGKKTSLASLVDNKKSAVSAVKAMVRDKADLEFRDVETNQLIKGELPTNLWEFGGAVADQKRRTYAQIAEKLNQTGDGTVDTSRIVDAMTEITLDDVYKSIPQVQRRAQEVIDQYDFAEYSIQDIERIIQIENDRLQAFYRGSGTQADAVVSALVANNLRDILDETIENATGEGVKALKKQYGDLAAIERDVVHRALHNAQAREAGLVDMFGIRTIGDVAAGMSGDITALKNSAAQIAGEGFIKALNDRDALTNRIFLVADQAYSN